MIKFSVPGALSLAALGLAVGGVCLATGQCQNNFNAPSPSALASKKGASQEIHWRTSMEDALKQSWRTGQPIFVDFYATWCPPCKMLEAQTYPDPTVVAESKNWVMLKVDTDEENELAARYGITNLPTLAVLRPDGQPLTATSGFLSAPELVQFLRDARLQKKR